MKILRTIILSVIICGGFAPQASAQYWELANQATNMLSTAFSGGLNYKGYVEVSYLKGFGENNGDFLGISTSQGTMVGQHFYMGIGLGVDMVMAHVDNSSWAPDALPGDTPATTKTGCVLPLFSDFRAIIGQPAKTCCVIGVQLGCSFMVSSNYIEVNRGYITSSECFYLKPSLGLRIPVSQSHPKQALDVALSYQLITPNYRPYYGYNNSAISLNSLGLTVSYEW